MGVPVVIAENGRGFPVRPVESGAPVLTVAASGLGVPIIVSERGAPFVVEGLYDPDALALFARMAVEPDDQRKRDINNLVVALKAAGVWEKFDCFYVMAAHDAQAARLNWIEDVYDLQAFNSPVFTVDRGYTGDGASAYLSTGFNAATAGGAYALDDAHLGVWGLTSTTSPTNQFDIGARASASGRQSVLGYQGTSNALFMRLNQDSDGGAPTTDAPTGHLVHTRTAAQQRYGYRNGAQIYNDTVTVSTAIPEFPMFILGANQAGSVLSTPSARQLGAAHIGASLTAQEVSDLHAALNTYLTAVGAVA